MLMNNMLEFIDRHLSVFVNVLMAIVTFIGGAAIATDRRTRSNKNMIGQNSEMIKNNKEMLNELRSIHRADQAAAEERAKRNHDLLVKLLKSVAVTQKDIEWIKEEQSKHN